MSETWHPANLRNGNRQWLATIDRGDRIIGEHFVNGETAFDAMRAGLVAAKVTAADVATSDYTVKVVDIDGIEIARFHIPTTTR